MPPDKVPKGCGAALRGEVAGSRWQQQAVPDAGQAQPQSRAVHPSPLLRARARPFIKQSIGKWHGGMARTRLNAAALEGKCQAGISHQSPYSQRDTGPSQG